MVTTTETSKKISIITPVFKPDKTKWMRLFTSIENQTSKNFEWIIVTDGNELDEHIFRIPPDSKYINLNDNYGPAVARNVGFMVADGDLIAYADADDELAPDRVRDLIFLAENHPDIKIIFSAYIIEQEGKEMLYNLLDYVQHFGLEFADTLKYRNVSIPLGVAHTKDAFVKGGFFQRGIVCGEDGILWRRIVERLDPSHDVLLTDGIAGIYHVNPTGQSRTQRRFEMGGFAFDGSKHPSHGQYLDEDWFATFDSKKWFDK